MTEPKKRKDYKPQASVNGVMHCDREHYWDVVDLNPERKSVPCPICAGMSGISGGLEKK
jgi:hypothetical protein